MKLLCITRKFPPQVGGMENFSYQLFLGLARENTQTKQLTLGKKQIHLLWYFPYLIFYVMFCARKYDVMYLSDGLMCFLGNVARVFAPKTKRVVTIHGLDVTYSNKLYQLYLKLFFKRSFDKYICDSEYTQEVVASFGNLDTKVVKLGINVDKFDGIEKNPAEVEEYIEDTTKPLLCLTVGRLVRRKGVLWFLRNVMPQLMEAHVKYIVAGDGPDREEIEKTVEELHLGEKVKICGRVPDDILNQLYLNADVFVMPNISVENDVEGFGLVALEGSLSGAVVVASGIEGIKDAITDGKNGILMESGNGKAYVDKILEIEKNREAYKSLGQEFSVYTKENCSYDRVTRDYMDEFRGV